MLHTLFEIAPFVIKLGQLCRQLARAVQVVRQQTLDADAHVVEPPGRVQTRADLKAEIGGNDRLDALAGHFKQCAHAGDAASAANAPESLMNQYPVIGVQRHQIRHRSHRHQVKQIRYRCLIRRAFSRRHEFTSKRCHRIKRYADAGECLAAEHVVLQIRIHDGGRRRKLVARQVMIGHQRIDVGCACRRHTRNARDAVVDGDDQLRSPCDRKLYDFRRQPVPKLEPIGNHVIDIGIPEPAQLANDQRRAGGTIGIKVADDQNAAAALAMRH